MSTGTGKGARRAAAHKRWAETSDLLDQVGALETTPDPSVGGNEQLTQTGVEELVDGGAQTEGERSAPVSRVTELALDLSEEDGDADASSQLKRLWHAFEEFRRETTKKIGALEGQISDLEKAKENLTVQLRANTQEALKQLEEVKEQQEIVFEVQDKQNETMKLVVGRLRLNEAVAPPTKEEMPAQFWLADEAKARAWLERMVKLPSEEELARHNARTILQTTDPSIYKDVNVADIDKKSSSEFIVMVMEIMAKAALRATPDDVFATTLMDLGKRTIAIFGTKPRTYKTAFEWIVEQRFALEVSQKRSQSPSEWFKAVEKFGWGITPLDRFDAAVLGLRESPLRVFLFNERDGVAQQKDGKVSPGQMDVDGVMKLLRTKTKEWFTEGSSFRREWIRTKFMRDPTKARRMLDLEEKETDEFLKNKANAKVDAQAKKVENAQGGKQGRGFDKRGTQQSTQSKAPLKSVSSTPSPSNSQAPADAQPEQKNKSGKV